METELKTDTVAASRELRDRIVDDLNSLHVPSLRHVQVDVERGVVTLRGQVNSYYAKQIAQHSARRVAAGHRVVDEISVAMPRARRSLLVSRLASVGATLVWMVALVGCSESSSPPVPIRPVTGQITFDGRPAQGAFVMFHPKNGSPSEFPAPRAHADAQGNFTLGTFNPQDGAPAGEYVVTVELRPFVYKDGEYESGPNILPPRYAAPRTSNLVVRVAEGPNTIPIKIVR